MNSHPIQRPLAEVGPMERRRNSPSYNQTTKKNMFQSDSSPLDSSPFASDSPRHYWKSRDSGSPARNNTENRSPLEENDHSSSAIKRSSIENLKRASRVKNSNMFAREHKTEYDPTTSPLIERPLASGRPLTSSVQGNAYGGKGLEGLRKEPSPDARKALGRSPLKSPVKMRDFFDPTPSSNQAQVSPTKSSLSSKSRYAQANHFDPESSVWSDEEDSVIDRQLPPGKSLHRHAKSVTFDAAPPQINEYEMTTPDPSSVASGSRDGSHDSTEDEEDESYDRGSLVEGDESFDASLEDTEKTPVVLPEDWRFMSPAVANEDLACKIEDPFNTENGSPSPTARPFQAVDARLTPTRNNSGGSDGEKRPLPPVPALQAAAPISRDRSGSIVNLSATVERAIQTPRKDASPPRPASISKAELQGMGSSSMPLEERLRLMMIQDTDASKAAAEQQRERRMRRSSPVRGHHASAEQIEDASVTDTPNDAELDFEDYKMPPRISRDSILRRVKDRNQGADRVSESPLMLSPISDREGVFDLDPDVPIPSTEIETGFERSLVKEEASIEDSDMDVYSIPQLYNDHLQAQSFMSAMEKLEVVHQSQATAEDTDEDDESHYSDASQNGEGIMPSSRLTGEEEGPPTPRAVAPKDSVTQLERNESKRMSLPQFAALLGDQDFGFGMESFMSESMSQEPVKQTSAPRQTWSHSFPTDSHDEARDEFEKHPSNQQYSVERPVTPEDHLLSPKFSCIDFHPDNRAQTPESVIRHPLEEEPASESPTVPEPVATIKSSGSKLKTRPSATPADIYTMAETRRQVSGERPDITKPPAKHLARPSVVAEGDEGDGEDDAEGEFSSISEGLNAETSEGLRQPKRKSSLIPLDVPVEGSDDLGIEGEFDRVIEAQKVVFNFSTIQEETQTVSPGHAEHVACQGFRPFIEPHANKNTRSQKGYLMRQNTKVIVASSASHESTAAETEEVLDPASRATRSAGNSPRKPSQTKTWTTEPWNGRIRRKSIRQSAGSPSKRAPSGPVPPLPGQESNVTGGLDIVNENEALQGTEEIGEDGERGRLFVKVVRVKDLDLPLPKGERSYFALTLDNGMHCVTTSWLELGKTAPVGQEFELIVLNELEFQLTLQTKLEEPKPKPAVESPTKAPKQSKTSAFSKVFSSPRKRKELELKQQEEAKRADRQRQEAQSNRRAAQPTAWDLLHKLVARDGSFARSYVCLKDHETHAYGKPLTVDVPCFNEWATEESTSNSYKSKRSGNDFGIQRKAPYKIGKLELQLLYVPKPKDARDEDMPKSMNACIRELKEAENATPKQWEGHLSQQGGDCPYWRRRFFTLKGTTFTAYHEATRQPRATINLAKASKLIDDKSALMRNDVSPKKGGRRKSAFAEEEEGYMFVEEGFRIRFANGEIIDFYADTAVEKDGWMEALADIVGKDPNKAKSWTDLVLARHRATASRPKRVEQGQPKKPSTAKQAPSSTKSAPPTPAKTFTPKPVPVPQKSPRRSDVAQRRADASKTRSVIF